MALKMIEGFEMNRDSGMDAMKRKWTVATAPGSVTGRLLGFGANGNFDFRSHSLGVQNIWVVGFAFQVASTIVTGDVFTIELFQDANRQVQLVLESVTSSTFKWVIKVNDVELDSTTTTFPVQVWQYVEFKVTIHNTAGAYELRVNQVNEMSGSAVDTSELGSGGADIIRYFSDDGDHQVDDMFILDSTGAQNNDFLGDSVIEGHLPTGDGALSQWTPSTAGAHYVLIDDPATADPDDSDFVSSSTVTNIDLFSFDVITFITGTIFGTQLNIDARLDTAGDRDVKGKIRSGGTNYDGGTFTVNGLTFSTFLDIIELDPDTAAAWTISGLDAAEFGFELVT